MKLDYLREFVILSEELNFSSAAARLFISQSALSRHISILEAELGGKLLERSTHNVELTLLGLRTSLKFRDILSQYDGLFSNNSELNQQISGNLSVGLLYYGVAEYYSSFLDHFSEKYPGIKLQVSNHHPHHLYQAIIRRNLDVGDMIFARGFMQEGLVFHKLYPLRLVALLPENHPLAQKDSIRLSEAANETLIDLEEDSVSSISTQEVIRKCGIVFKDVRYTKHIETVPAALLKYNGIHITGERVKRQSFPGIKYMPISDEEAFTYHCFAHLTDNPNKLIPIFINEALHYFKEKQGLS